MKKKRIANLIMVVIIVLIAAAGILGAGHILGWFDRSEAAAVLTDIRSLIAIERSGVSYSVGEDLQLRQGDVLKAQTGGSATVRIGESYLSLNAGTELTINDPSVAAFSAHVSTGEVFCSAHGAFDISFAEEVLKLENSTVYLSVHAGAQSVGVLSGQIAEVQPGQQCTWVNGEKSTGVMDIQSLNDFALTCIRSCPQALCFTTAQIDTLEAERLAQQKQELEDLLNSQKPTDGKTEATTPPETTQPPATTEPPVITQPPATTEPPVITQPPATTEPPATTQPPATTEPPVTTQPSATTEPPVTTQPPATTEPPATTQPEVPKTYNCTITIRCDTILNNMDSLNPDKAAYVPESGVILQPISVEFTEGESAFDVLKRVCETANIPLEYSWQPLYDGYYLEGINHLYEFDCGDESGWMYKVNGWFPNYTISHYKLSDGDHIVLCYTCKGLGTDVGAPEWTG